MSGLERLIEQVRRWKWVDLALTRLEAYTALAEQYPWLKTLFKIAVSAVLAVWTIAGESWVPMGILVALGTYVALSLLPAANKIASVPPRSRPTTPPSGSHQPESLPASLQQQPEPHPIQAFYADGLTDLRIVRDNSDDPNAPLFDILRVRLTNTSLKALTELEVSISSRSHVTDGAQPYFFDYGPVFVRGRRDKTNLSPGASEDFVVISRNYFLPEQFVLGDHMQSKLDGSDYIHQAARHFITVRITCAEAPALVRTAIVRSTSTEPTLDTQEFDWRVWADETQAPRF